MESIDVEGEKRKGHAPADLQSAGNYLPTDCKSVGARCSIGHSPADLQSAGEGGSVRNNNFLAQKVRLGSC